MPYQNFASSHLTAVDALAAQDLFFAKGWTDGLPIVPPTEERVAAMLAGVGRDPQQSIGALPPSYGEATIEKIAVNAVMAGCLPEYLPVVVTALEAMLVPEFNLYGVQTTTGGRAPLVLVNGPYAQRIGMNGGGMAFGSGNRANATIGRAVRLALVNIGGATPGTVDKSTFGHPGKYTYCFCENEAESPWEPLHVERGFKKDQSAVTVLDAESPHFFSYTGPDPESLLYMLSDTLGGLGNTLIRFMTNELIIAFSPEHARVFAGKGWSKAAIKRRLFETARRPYKELLRAGVAAVVRRGGEDAAPEWLNAGDPERLVPIVKRPEDIMVIVAGGAGVHSAYILPWMTPSVTREITHINRP